MKEIIIVDKQDITCFGIEVLLRETGKTSSIRSVKNKKELIQILMSGSEAIVVLDYALFDFTSVDDLMNVSDRFPDVQWLLFSDELSDDFLKRMLFNNQKFSAVLKTCNLDEIKSALAHILRNERFVCSRVMNQLLSTQQKSIGTTDNRLTTTEKEILKEIASGKTTKEIAATRNLSFHTIITHRKNIFRKLEVNNVHEATKYAMRAGIIDIAEYYI